MKRRWIAGAKARYVSGLFLISAAACASEPDGTRASDAESPVLDPDTHLYFRSNLTGWGVDASTRLRPTLNPAVFTLSYDVDQPWMLGQPLDAVFTETNQLDGWGTLQRYYRSETSPLLVPGKSPLVLAPSSNGALFQVTYSALGNHTVLVDREAGAFSVALTPRIEFVDSGAPLIALGESAADFGDVDADGDPDLLLTGSNGSTCIPGVGCNFNTALQVYRNDGGAWAPITPPGDELIAVHSGDVKFADYDRDGLLDLYIGGNQGTVSAFDPNRVYHNTGPGGFAVAYDHPGLGLELGQADFADIDGDGDLDLAYAGEDVTGTPETVLAINDGGTFVPDSGALETVTRAALTFGDYDSDGDPDLFLAGQSFVLGDVAILYRNDGGQFVDIQANLPGFRDGAGAFGDFDADGDLDLAFSGETFRLENEVIVYEVFTRIYRNDGGTFVEHPFASSTGHARGDVLWADADLDGDLDLFAMGVPNSGFVPILARWYRNEAGSFGELASVSLPGSSYGDADVADVDSDGDPDLLVTGWAESTANPSGRERRTVLYENVGAVP
jgi:hypothetical protein